MKKLCLVLVIIFILVGCGVKTDYTKDYQNLEAKFLTAGKAFVANNKNLVPTDDNIYSIKLEQLYTGKYLGDKLIDPKSKKECDKQNSYIRVKRVNEDFDFTLYLKCDNYETK
jgi:hypothetical protein